MFLGSTGHQADVDEAKANKSEATKTASGIAALAASSLQQIGGGDVSSILAGTNTELVDYARITAENTTKLATEGTQPNPPASVAK